VSIVSIVSTVSTVSTVSEYSESRVCLSSNSLSLGEREPEKTGREREGERAVDVAGMGSEIDSGIGSGIVIEHAVE
jgi:hypothetical protein